MHADMLVESRLHRDLFGFDSAIFLSVVLVDELDSKDRVIGVERCGLFDTMLLLAVVEP